LRGVNEGNLRAIIGRTAGDYWAPNGRQERERERVAGASVSVRREIVSVRREIRRLKFGAKKNAMLLPIPRGYEKTRKNGGFLFNDKGHLDQPDQHGEVTFFCHT
jgi:hypothetical protein